jgi:hypothetical protein
MFHATMTQSRHRPRPADLCPKPISAPPMVSFEPIGYGRVGQVHETTCQTGGKQAPTEQRDEMIST